MILCPHCGKEYRVTSTLTKRQLEVFLYIERFIAVNRYAPSYDEIRVAIGVQSLGTVYDLLDELQTKGTLRRGESGAPRSITLLVRSDELA